MVRYSLLMLLSGLCSCGIYRQNVVNAPLLQQKGQGQLSGHVSFSGLEGQGAYALTDKIAIAASYANLGTKKEIYSTNNYEITKHFFGEVGAGIFQSKEKNKVRELFLFVGKGKTSHFLMVKNAAGIIVSTNKNVRYNRYVVQADFGEVDKRLTFIITPRILAIHYYDIFDDSGVDYQSLAKFHLYTEGVFTLRYSLFKFMAISGQLGGTLPVTHSVGNNYYEISPFNGSIGLIFNLTSL